MKTLIIPCAGRSSRFPNMRPKWMLYYPDGKMMVEKALEGLVLEEFDRIIFTIVKEHVKEYQAEEILEDIFCFSNSEKFELCILDDFTSCQAETVYLTLIDKQVTGSFAVKDSDNFICVDTGRIDDYVVGINISTFSKEVARLSAKSFLILNEQGIITDIIEKQIKSEYICVGMYGFGNAELFKEAYLHLKDVSDKRYEIYLSHIISYLIGTQKTVYRYVEAENYEDWGTIEDWNIVLKEKQTVIINMDGLLFDKNEKYGNDNWGLPLQPNEKNLLQLRQMAEQGAQIIVLTSMEEQYEEMIKKVLENYGINVYQIITGCYLAHKLLIGQADKTIPYPGCDAINVSLNTDLKDYF